MAVPTPPPISLKDALSLLNNEVPVSVRFVTCDRRRNTGGEFRELKATRVGFGNRKREALMRAATAAEVAAATGVSAPPAPIPKNPNHYENATRNLVDTTTGKMVKVHIYLIVAVMGRKVFL